MKINSAFSILKMLYDHSSIKCSEIAKKLNISERSVYRYIAELIACGIPINVQRGRYNGGVWLTEEYKKSLNTFGRLLQAYAG